MIVLLSAMGLHESDAVRVSVGLAVGALIQHMSNYHFDLTFLCR
jgi:hypothetical protein